MSMQKNHAISFFFFCMCVYVCMLSCAARGHINFWTLVCREWRDNNFICSVGSITQAQMSQGQRMVPLSKDKKFYSLAPLQVSPLTPRSKEWPLKIFICAPIMHQGETRRVLCYQCRGLKKNTSFDFIECTNEVFTNLSSSLSIDLGIDALVLDKGSWASNGVWSFLWVLCVMSNMKPSAWILTSIFSLPNSPVTWGNTGERYTQHWLYWLNVTLLKTFTAQ